jgi:hypothetical protein
MGMGDGVAPEVTQPARRGAAAAAFGRGRVRGWGRKCGVN